MFTFSIVYFYLSKGVPLLVKIPLGIPNSMSSKFQLYISIYAHTLQYLAESTVENVKID